MIRKHIIYLISVLLLTSCYHKELEYEFTTSDGGVVCGSSYYYLANIKELRLPKGIARFPKGGQPKITNQLFGLFATDTNSSSTLLITKLGLTKGWPSRYATRMDKNEDFIVFGILSITQNDSIEGIYLYNLRKESLIKYSPLGALPAISKENSMLAYCIDNRLIVEDSKSKVVLMSFLLNAKPAFVTWQEEDKILIFYKKPLMVDILELSSGKILHTELNYLPNLDQEMDVSTMTKALKIDNDKIKDLLFSNSNINR